MPKMYPTVQNGLFLFVFSDFCFFFVCVLGFLCFWYFGFIIFLRIFLFLCYFYMIIMKAVFLDFFLNYF